jgi:hypothetical protein
MVRISSSEWNSSFYSLRKRTDGAGWSFLDEDVAGCTVFERE